MRYFIILLAAGLAMGCAHRKQAKTDESLINYGEDPDIGIPEPPPAPDPMPQ